MLESSIIAIDQTDEGLKLGKQSQTIGIKEMYESSLGPPAG